MTYETPHAAPATDVLDALGTTPEGLDESRVAQRLAEHGPNALPESPPTPWWRMLFRQFLSPLIGILAIACIITSIQQHWVDAGAIFIVIILNAALGFYQERKAERDVRALQSLSRTIAHVRRDGALRKLPSEQLVPGDIIVLESGDRIPADARLTEVNALQVDESALTGESLAASKDTEPVASDAALGDRRCMVYSGTHVTSGRATAVVTATGTGTELGTISELVSDAPPRTPLQILTHSLERRIGVAVILAVVFVFAVGLVSGYSLSEMFRVAVALSVATIPESLPIILTVAMSVGVSRMARRGAIVRTLPSVETLGSTTVIASDKTGTLTQNRLTVEQLWTPVGDHAPGTPPTDAVRALLRAGALTNEAVRSAHGDLTGDAVDVAMASVALDAGVVDDAERAEAPLAEMPYEPALAFSQTVRREDGRLVVYAKGSPEAILSMSERMPSPTAGTRPVDPDLVHAASLAMAEAGLRVIAVAMRVLDDDAFVDGSAFDGPLPRPEGLTFLGMQGMTDPPREAVPEAVAACREAGIAVKMVTGDHPTTAQAIAARLGFDTASEPLTGAEMRELDDEQLADRLESTSVAARVTPRDKLRIVRALQSRGEVVAVTGDGVNDAPALKAATIGVSMGKSGTDVAREASDLILTDDNFVTIVEAVRQGRVTFAAIRKATFFLLSTALAGVLCLALNVLMDQPLLFLPVQILWINLVTSGIQDIALALEPAEGDELRRAPRRSDEGVLSRTLWIRTVVTGVWMGIWVLLTFTWALGQGYEVEHARTLAMTVFVLFNFFQIGSARAEYRSALTLNPLRNKPLVLTAIGAIAMLWAVSVWPPAANLFGLVPLNLWEWAGAGALAFSVFVIVELEKLVRARWR